jgi:pimeloyl-ACP methyl ester carboxylesterase
LISVIFYFGCTTNGKAKKSDDLKRQEIPTSDSLTESRISLKDSVFYLSRNADSIRIKILVPDKIKGYILFLHGWNLPADEMCMKTDFCSAFLDSGYVLVFPDFGKTTYQWQNYPQTKKSYLKYPTRKWMTDTFLIHLQREFQIFSPGQRNFVFGVSTGGRGAALLALENPGIFKAAACLSADFDHAALGNEPINNGYYGSISLFPERWTGKDNIHNRASEFKAGLYLAHGEKDKICPVSQTINFDAELKRVKSAIKVKTVIDPSGDHTYAWWAKQISSVNEFFNQF